MGTQQSCSIILPCYNPQRGWDGSVLKSYLEVKQFIADVEIVLVNDGSTLGIDNAHIDRLRGSIANFQYCKLESNSGKGAALRKGVAEATGALIIYTDIDFPYTTGSLQEIYNEIAQGTELAVGVKGNEYYKKVPLVRKVISKTLRWMIGLFLNIPITDTQCGLKGFNKRLSPIFLQTKINRYLFDLEFIKYVSKHKHSCKPIDIELRDNVEFSTMNYKILLPELLNFIRIVISK